ncbi:tyrosine-type recombinase/integrase [Klebsiella quasivariicola]|uniref:tyrosine-type recombinase/integrase n=1 Tax=Klebsiella quasivariicola TaxID=2026240 RepID=UPI0024792FE9|nr:tyrosine-type recombinase/integrase [Klebsiella quasivariicola]
MAAPRKHKINIENLYVKLDKRTNRIYWQYKDPFTGRWQGFGSDEAVAKAAATELNRLFASQQLEQSYALIDHARQKQNQNRKTQIRFKEWVKRYSEILDKRNASGELSDASIYERKFAAKILSDRIANTPLDEVGSREMAAILQEYIDEGKNPMAKNIRSSWADLFKEAQFAGEVPPGFNPALSTRKPNITVKRSRLSLSDWQKIYEAARINYEPWAINTMNLALITGQRLSDVLNMQFKNIKDGYLYVTQIKTGNKIAIPLALRCDAIGMSLEEAINQCRDRALSPYLVHHARNKGNVKAGKPLNKSTVSKMFATCHGMAGIDTAEGRTRASFHEQRSLSSRLYAKQGINTKDLLGHKSTKMAELYSDERVEKWTYIVL